MAAKGKGQDVWMAKRVGARPEKKIPIGPKRLGFFCESGIEPSELEDSGVIGRVNQDRCFICQPLFHDFNVGNEHWFCAGVCDGLGLFGDLLADFAVGELITSLRRHPMRTSKPRLALRDIFFEVDETIRTHPEIRLAAVSSGTTALIVVIHQFTLWVAHAGDCAAVLASLKKKEAAKRGGAAAEVAVGTINDEEFEIVARKLTQEHTPTDLVQLRLFAVALWRPGTDLPQSGLTALCLFCFGVGGAGWADYVPRRSARGVSRRGRS